MQIILGFLLGVIASLVAWFIYRPLERRIPLSKHKRLLAFLNNPQLFIRIRRDTDERRIKKLIEGLFRAWGNKDIDAYLSCWADDAKRIIGSKSSIEEGKDHIGEKFKASCKMFSEIKVPATVFDEITVGPTPDMAIAKVHYRFELRRERDGLPLAEESQEVYSLRKNNGQWIIASNIDHHYEIT